MSTYKKLTTVCAAVVLAFGLAACGGGDDDDTAEAPATMEPTGPTPEETAAAEKARADAAEQALADKEAADKVAAMTAAGMQLHSALTASPLTNLGDVDATEDGTQLASLTPSGITVSRSNREDLLPTPVAQTYETSPTMQASDAVDALGGWAGQHYAHRAGPTSNEARVYSFKEDAKGKPAPEVFATVSTTRDEVSAYVAADRQLTFADNEASSLFAADMFPAAGTTTYSSDDTTGSVSFAGTYEGAPGNYRCTAATCSATMTADGISLVGTWTFVHDAGAETSVADANYQYFGWWLRKVAGVPDSASAFFGVNGDGNAVRDVGAAEFRGTASYSGAAAGKFAIDNPLGGSDAGHFTADVSLDAKFGNVTTVGAQSGISGSLSNFMANEQEVNWAVTLRRADWGATGAETSGTFMNSANGTVWAIDGNASDPSGSWNGRMYDDGDPSSTVPTVAMGVFQSRFGSTHTMVGGFGARKE